MPGGRPARLCSSWQLLSVRSAAAPWLPLFLLHFPLDTHAFTPAPHNSHLQNRCLLQVNSSVQEAQYLADKEFTTVDPTVWDALPGIDTPVLLVTGTLVGGGVGVPAVGDGQAGRAATPCKLRRQPIWAVVCPTRLLPLRGSRSSEQRESACPLGSLPPSPPLPQDAVVPPVNTDLIAGQIPGAQVLRISGWGHGLVVGDAANQLAQAVDSFLGPGDPGGP